MAIMATVKRSRGSLSLRPKIANLFLFLTWTNAQSNIVHVQWSALLMTVQTVMG